MSRAASLPGAELVSQNMTFVLVNKMEICDIETSLYYFRFKRNGDRFEDVDSWYNRIMKGRELNNNIKIYLSMLLKKYYSSNIKCADV